MRLLNLIFLLLTISVANFCSGQGYKCEAKVINTKDAFEQAVKNDPLKKLVALQKVIPGLLIDMPYATTRNFTKTILYRHPVAYLRVAPANALKLVQAELNKKGLA